MNVYDYAANDPVNSADPSELMIGDVQRRLLVVTIDAGKFNQALAEFQVFGSRRRIPIEVRWRELLPDIAPSDFDELKERCKNIEAFALGLAEQVRDQKLSQDVARRQLAEKFQYLTPDRVSHTWSQAMYYSMQ